MKQYREYNGRKFEVVHRDSTEGQNILHSVNYCKEWDSLYTKPSSTKIAIKEKWRIWCSDTCVHCVNCEILGYLGGVQTFSIYGQIDNAIFKITPTRNIIVL